MVALLEEGKIYIMMKEWLRSMCWRIVGGEPPAGTNNIPRVEIKDPAYQGKGSKGSKKVDLVSFKEGFFLLTEIKAQYSSQDVEKLEEITQRRELRGAFLTALKERRIMPPGAHPDKYYLDGTDYLIKSLAFSYPRKAPYGDYIFFIASSDSISVEFGPKVSAAVRDLFSRPVRCSRSVSCKL